MFRWITRLFSKSSISLEKKDLSIVIEDHNRVNRHDDWNIPWFVRNKKDSIIKGEEPNVLSLYKQDCVRPIPGDQDNGEHHGQSNNSRTTS